MSDDLLKRYTRPSSQRTTGSPATPPAADRAEEEYDTPGPFAVLRGARDRAVMLELRKKDGTTRALAYAWLHQLDFDPSTGLTLHFQNHPVTLTGQNLHPLAQHLCRHRVLWIQEADEPTLLQAKDEECVVEQIRW